jgi:hypothetical protein
MSLAKFVIISIFLVINCQFSFAQYASDQEIVARTILREAFERGNAAYDAVAWVIYNRVKSSSFPSTPKSVCLQQGQFAVWSSYWGQTNIPLNPTSTSHRDYSYCFTLAGNIMKLNPPKTGADPTNGALFFLTYSSLVASTHPNGILIGGNWFFQKW